MSDPDARNLAIALQIRDRHTVTPRITCSHCLPPDTRWPCGPFQVAAGVIDQLAAERFPPAAVHPDWLDGSRSYSPR